MLDLTIIVVTSPAPSNPSTDLISQSIESCNLVAGLAECPVIIVMDGYKVGPVDRTKMGRITEETAARYEEYHQALLVQFAGPRYRIVRNETHQGFALSVKAGLELCGTTYCMVTQYDRLFCAPFTRIEDLIYQMEENAHIRYIGFPTSSNVNHDKFISTNYNLHCLNQPEIKLQLGDNLYLQPTVFWYDSQHLGHVQRYLQIYRPYKNMPPHLRDIIGIYSIKDMLLRPGDFIEDRFGQVQRRLLWVLATKGVVTKEIMKGKTPVPLPVETDECSEDEKETEIGTSSVSVGTDYKEESNASSIPTSERNVVSSTDTVSSAAPEVNLAVVVELFHWYGTYLCWQNTCAMPFNAHNVHTPSDTVVMVRHMRGRQLTSEGIAWKIANLASTGPSRGGYWSQADRVQKQITDAKISASEGMDNRTLSENEVVAGDEDAIDKES